MWARSLAAALLGLPLTVAIIGLLALVWPGDPTRTTLPWLLLSFPLWTAVMSLAFIARSGLRAWLWMGGATLLCFSLIHVVKLLGWVELPA
ncbi:hypothetical protein [Xanthomonas sp. XNM01]|uniref:hypothetical protein n=1 Tax=Xanthomonas sp. XNM01 TaxID=2769289 RepID=UPI0017820632|nr:hypothetical protein [Xanthomonas sp. XNM01]MBD9370635.1 hypothetical protein [Xanthomonas sp. XNM01]